MYKVVFLILVVTAVAEAYACLPDSCDRMKCKPLNCTTGERLKKNGGFCRCCDKCILILEKGDSCGFFSKGLPPFEECDTGLKCDSNTRKCVEDN
ncbi:hypothetical protein TNCT_540191 [Trichonephila clavata]|uniref:Uncharacterized protein n=2 Tax=Trichonephila clavata TaxID=2740835 RepID=A0A8X6KWF3_TRICU|nr:hypothetical protein TNCT_540191 [Trichonephila clavata]